MTYYILSQKKKIGLDLNDFRGGIPPSLAFLLIIVSDLMCYKYYLISGILL